MERRSVRAPESQTIHISRSVAPSRYTICSMPSITVLDTNWTGRARSIAAALLESDGHRALIDPGPESTLETLRSELASRGISVSDLDAILLTHIHLDHAGVTGSLVKENPRLMVYVHKIGAPHVVNPSRLLASANRLWGDGLQRLYGEILPVPRQNLHILQGGETLELGNRKLEVVYTPGHASHHVSYFDHAEGVAFVGDTAGIRIENAPYILLATPPPDIDLAQWDSSFAAILGRRPIRLFLTHFGFSDNPAAHITEYRERLRKWSALAAKALSSSPDQESALKFFLAAIQEEVQQFLPAEEVEHYNSTAAFDLSFLGLARYHQKRAQTAP